jgi:hypothetical protein
MASGYGVPMYGTPHAQPYAPTKEQETDMLKGQAEYLQDQLSGIQKRLEELEKDKK